MVPMGPWIYQYRTDSDVAKKILEQETGVAPLPLPPGGVQATYLEVKPISINAFSKDKKDRLGSGQGSDQQRVRGESEPDRRGQSA